MNGTAIAVLQPDVAQIELDLLLTAIRMRYGYDFSQYARPTLLRRAQDALRHVGADNVGELLHRLLREPTLFPVILSRLTVGTTDMFRDPALFAALRTHVFPVLSSYPEIRVWDAGCSTGEELYGLAIALREAGLLDRCRIYATDLDPLALARAREGVFPVERVKRFTRNYHASGGRGSFSDFYTARYGHVAMDRSLVSNVLFNQHNLAQDASFGEMHLILCRNVMIYFNQKLRERVLGLFQDSLVRRGFLCVGAGESLVLTPAARAFEEVTDGTRIFRLR